MDIMTVSAPSGRRGLSTARLTIPLEFFIPHEDRAQTNHSQTIRRLAERGGLSPQEAVAIIQDEDYKFIRGLCVDAAWDILNTALEAWNASRVAPGK